jgi:hypothetical protein
MWDACCKQGWCSAAATCPTHARCLSECTEYVAVEPWYACITLHPWMVEHGPGCTLCRRGTACSDAFWQGSCCYGSCSRWQQQHAGGHSGAATPATARPASSGDGWLTSSRCWGQCAEATTSSSSSSSSSSSRRRGQACSCWDKSHPTAISRGSGIAWCSTCGGCGVTSSTARAATRAGTGSESTRAV